MWGCTLCWTGKKCPFGRLDNPTGASALRQYTRLTLVLSDPQQNYGINNSNNEVVQSYDILAVRPETERMFQSACISLEVDIISLDLTSRVPFPIKAGYLRQALSRGISLEVLYSPLVADATARRNIIGNLRTILRLALGRRGRTGGSASGGGLLISSGGEATWQYRAPADVLNLAGLMGVPAHLRKPCLTSVPEAVFMHAATRKHTYRGAVAVIPPPPPNGGGRNEDRRGAQAIANDMLEDFIEFK